MQINHDITQTCLKIVALWKHVRIKRDSTQSGTHAHPLEFDGVPIQHLNNMKWDPLQISYELVN